MVPVKLINEEKTRILVLVETDFCNSTISGHTGRSIQTICMLKKATAELSPIIMPKRKEESGR